MRAGLLNERVKLLVPITERNDVGELVTQYVCSTQMKCRVIYGGGSRDVENIGEIVHNKTQIFEVRIYQNINDYDILEWNGQRYRIADVTTDNQQRKKVITAEKIND